MKASDLYDGFDSKHGGQFSKNDYYGLMCECLVPNIFGHLPDPSDCRHATMIADIYYADFMG